MRRLGNTAEILIKRRNQAISNRSTSRPAISVASNTQIADIYNDQTMKIKVPFLNMEAAAIVPGSPAVLTLSDTLEQLDGTVLSVSSMDEALTGGRLVRYVTIQVANPGGLHRPI